MSKRYEFPVAKPTQAFGMFEQQDLVKLLHEVAKECRKPGSRNVRLRRRCAELMDRAGFEITKFRQVTSHMAQNGQAPVAVGDRVTILGMRGVVAQILGRAALVHFDDGSAPILRDVGELVP